MFAARASLAVVIEKLGRRRDGIAELLDSVRKSIEQGGDMSREAVSFCTVVATSLPLRVCVCVCIDLTDPVAGNISVVSVLPDGYER